MLSPVSGMIIRRSFTATANLMRKSSTWMAPQRSLSSSLWFSSWSSWIQTMSSCRIDSNTLDKIEFFSKNNISLKYSTTSLVSMPLDEFRDPVPRNKRMVEEVGQSWSVIMLQRKSYEDLHKLWYILYKERNMLLTEENICRRTNTAFPQPERLDKVKSSMENLKTVLNQRKKVKLNAAKWKRTKDRNRLIKVMKIEKAKKVAAAAARRQERLLQKVEREYHQQQQQQLEQQQAELSASDESSSTLQDSATAESAASETAATTSAALETQEPSKIKD